MKATSIGSGALLLLGAISTWLALDAQGVLYVLERTTVLELAREGWLGGLATSLSIVVACGVTTLRSPVRAGLALGILSMSALSMYWRMRWHPIAFAVWCAVFVTCALIAWRAVRLSSEPAAARILGTSIGVGALLAGSLATMLWWPQSYSMSGYGPHALPTPHVALATVLLVATLFDLRARRARALLWLSAAGVSLSLAPHFGGVSSGCRYSPGPLEHLEFPRLVAPVALLLWIGPADRFLRRRIAP